MRREVLGVGFDPVTAGEAADRALMLIKERRCAYVCTPNPEMLMAAQRDPALMAALRGADLVLCDGVGVLWASRRLNAPLPERVAGIDFFLSLLERMSGTVYLLGGAPGTAELAADTIRARFPAVTVCGVRDGYFTDEQPVLADIRAAAPDVLAVCLGSPKQERFMSDHRDLNAGLMIGLGGAVDVLAGTVKRAPAGWRALGLEWLYRLLRQPRRIFRQLRLPAFVLRVLFRGRGERPARQAGKTGPR